MKSRRPASRAVETYAEAWNKNARFDSPKDIRRLRPVKSYIFIAVMHYPGAPVTWKIVHVRVRARLRAVALAKGFKKLFPELLTKNRSLLISKLIYMPPRRPRWRGRRT